VYYRDRRGRIVMPPGIPFLPIAFESTPTTSRARLDRQWLDVGQALADDMRARGLSGAVTLPPEIDDIRPWLWSGFAATVGYLYRLELPHSGKPVDLTARRRIGEAVSRTGLTVDRPSDPVDVFRCIEQAQQHA